MFESLQRDTKIRQMQAITARCAESTAILLLIGCVLPWRTIKVGQTANTTCLAIEVAMPQVRQDPAL
jgi:hypothetical protein